jgi:hypothetical protein
MSRLSILWAGVVCFLLGLGACSSESRTEGFEESSPQTSEDWEGDVEAGTTSVRPQGGTEEDWMVLRDVATQAWDEGWDTLPMGESMVQLGLSFVGTEYAPGTLEVAGEEDVVVNLQQMDCVTLVENTLALARFIRMAEPDVLQSDLRTRGLYRSLLEEIRYRAGRVDGYPSRLHYFSDWIRDNQVRGLVREITLDLGGEPDVEAIDYMSTHPDAYRQMADPFNLTAMKQVEFELSSVPRYKLLEENIPAVASRIENGDIIAATSTVDGLDIAHTGLAYWKGGALHLLHAPLVGEAVEVSRLPLSERMLRLDTQDGIRVVRPLAPPGGGTEEAGG